MRGSGTIEAEQDCSDPSCKRWRGLHRDDDAAGYRLDRVSGSCRLYVGAVEGRRVRCSRLDEPDQDGGHSGCVWRNGLLRGEHPAGGQLDVVPGSGRLQVGRLAERRLCWVRCRKPDEVHSHTGRERRSILHGAFRSADEGPRLVPLLHPERRQRNVSDEFVQDGRLRAR